MIIDTPGFDDEGALGTLRIRKTCQVLNKTDIAVLVVDARGRAYRARSGASLIDSKEGNPTISSSIISAIYAGNHCLQVRLASVRELELVFRN